MKRVLSLVLALVLVLGMMPTFAAGETGAQELYANGFITGANGDLMVDKSLTRAEMAVILSELFGLKDEAMNYAAPADFSDVNDHWAKSYIAYGQAQGWFSGYPDGTYDPEGTVTSQELAAFVLNALGFNGDYEWSTSVAFAATLGINVGSSDALTRGAAFESIWETVNTPAKGEEVALGVKLGKLEPEAPVVTDLVVERVYANNLKQIFVEFNSELDADSAETVANYTITDEDGDDLNTNDYKVEVLADGKTAAITFLDADPTADPAIDGFTANQQDKFTVTVEDVEDVNGNVVVVEENEVQLLDTKLPEVLSAEVVGVSTIKVTFSEPMDPATFENDNNFEVNEGKYYIKSVTGQKNNTELLVEIYTSLKTGNLPFEVQTGVTDYAGFGVIGKTFNLSVVEDTTAPVVTGYKSASPTKVVLVWSEDITLESNDEDDFYHTNSNNPAEALPTVDGNEMTIKFHSDNELAVTSYVYVAKEAVKDLWNNDNAQQMIKVDVTIDKTAPTVTGIDFKAENKIVVKFSEEMKDADRDYFTLLDDEGKEVKNIIGPNGATLSDDEKSITIVFKEKLDGGDYSLVVEDIKDVAGNEIDKVTVPFTVTDKTAPVIDNDTTDVKIYKINNDKQYILKVTFPESMATTGDYRVNDLSKYLLTDNNDDDNETIKLEDINNVSITVLDSAKAVEIKFPVNNDFYDEDDHLVVDDADTLTIARVADKSDNYTLKLSSGALEIAEPGKVEIKKIEVTDLDEVVITFSDELTKFEEEDFTISDNTGAINFSRVGTDVNDDGQTVATIALADDYVTETGEFEGFAYNASDITVEIAGTTVSENKYGEKLKADYTAAQIAALIKDKITPVIATADINGEEDVDNVVATTGVLYDVDENLVYDRIVLTFVEALDPAYGDLATFEVDGFDVTAIEVDGNQVRLYVDNTDGNLEEGVSVSLVGTLVDRPGNNEVEAFVTEIADVTND